jgi:hypothetical protein
MDSNMKNRKVTMPNRIQQSIGNNQKKWEVIKENILGSDNRHTIKETVTDPTDMTNTFINISPKWLIVFQMLSIGT